MAYSRCALRSSNTQKDGDTASFPSDNGRLLVGANRIEWQDLKNTSKSRSWAYSEIKEFKREGNELKIKPYSGDSFEFKVNGRMMSDDIYNAIADRIVAAHR